MSCPVFSVADVAKTADLFDRSDVQRVTRELGTRFDRLPSQEQDPGKLIVDFSGIERVGNLAAKELSEVLYRVINDSGHERFFVLQGLGEDVRHGMDMGLARLRKVAISQIEDGLEFIGSVAIRGAIFGKPESDVMAALNETQVTASIADIIRLTKYPRGQVQNLVSKLYDDQGLIVRLGQRYVHLRWYHRS